MSSEFLFFLRVGGNDCVRAMKTKTKRAREGGKSVRRKSINTPLTALNHFLNYTARTRVAVCPEPEAHFLCEISSPSSMSPPHFSSVDCSGVSQVVRLETRRGEKTGVVTVGGPLSPGDEGVRGN